MYGDMSHVFKLSEVTFLLSWLSRFAISFALVVFLVTNNFVICSALVI